MSNVDFQNWMKEKVEQQDFEPPKEGWQKLQTALQLTPDTPKRKSRKIIWSIAAAVILLLGASIAYYTVMKIDTSNMHSIAQENDVLHKEKPLALKKTQLENNKTSNNNGIITLHKSNKTLVTIKKAPINIPVKKNTANTPQSIVSLSHTGHPSIIKEEPLIDTIARTIKPQQTITIRNISDYVEQNAHIPIARQAIELGIVANGGSNNIGSVQYQIAFNARKHLTRKIFVDAAFAITATAVAFNNHYTFDGITINPNDGLGNNVGSEPIESQTPVTTVYKQNVYAVGLAPKVGLRLNKHMNFMIGGFVNRNINTEIGLSNTADLSILNVRVPTSQSINDWTTGLTGGLEFRMMNRMAAYAGYRQSINNYAYFSNRYHKISGIEFGLKLKLGQ